MTRKNNVDKVESKDATNSQFKCETTSAVSLSKNVL